MTDIPINDIDPVKSYTAAGGETGYAYTFPIFETGDLTVLELTSAGVLTTLIEGTDYSVAGAGAQNGGTITFDITAYPSGAMAGARYILLRDLDVKRVSDFLTGGDFKAETVNRELDKIIMMIQERAQDLKRSLTLQRQDEQSSISFAVETNATRQGKVLKFSDDGNSVEAGASSTDIENAATNAASAAADAIQTAADRVQTGIDSSAAAASALEAANSAAGGLYETIVDVANADSPVVPTLGQGGNLFSCDCTAGDIIINLDALSSYGQDVKYAFVKIDASANEIIINRGGTDTINGSTSLTIDSQYETNVLLGDQSSGAWLNVVQTTGVLDNTITNAKMADDAIDTAEIVDDAVTGSKILDAAITFAKIASATFATLNEMISGASQKIVVASQFKLWFKSYSKHRVYTGTISASDTEHVIDNTVFDEEGYKYYIDISCENSTAGTISMEFSEDNGTTYLTTAGDYIWYLFYGVTGIAGNRNLTGVNLPLTYTYNLGVGDVGRFNVEMYDPLASNGTFTRTKGWFISGSYNVMCDVCLRTPTDRAVNNVKLKTTGVFAEGTVTVYKEKI